MKSYNIYHNGRIIGRDDMNEEGRWSHKWFSQRDNCFERGSWRGRADGDNIKKWTYEEIDLN